ncbi:MAG TPA: prenyltransferase/squalene oxidase repeat-containing protein [Solirubrobacteraceae bacterium]|nr:prenyltransferase/squalene oxidase repeat-containing protein [Solirubrobacteraceae bacterium]
MSWQLASFGILAIGLVAGFAWYERSRPDAKVLALVGTLAAFAALGRIAFAALPNVKPTTDIVLIAGYALGGGPGFVVGAVAALSSNFFFGQGPWTPWQMAGWGLTGILGAGLARLTGRRIGRWPLALISFVIGFGFTALQDLGDWVTYSDHSLAQLGVYVGKGIGFDLIHATGCLLFALAFGPALLHSLSRFRLRLNVTWLTPALLILAVGVAVTARPAGAASSPLTYLLQAQNQDGGFGPAPGQPSSSEFTGWASLALSAAGHTSGSAVAYVERNPGTDPGSLERSILAIHAGAGPVGGLLTRLESQIKADGSIRNQTNLTAFAVLEALAGTGHRRTVRRAVRFIRRQQNRDGGFPSTPGQSSNAQSTAFAVQGLDAVGVPLSTLRHSPVAYLDGLIGPSGQISYARGQDQTPVWVTAQAELALLGKPLPVAAVRPARVVPVNRKSPARGKPRAAVHTRGRVTRAKRRRAHLKRAERRPAASRLAGQLGSDAGALTALLLAPVDM